jgi:uncharacterized membrane protein YagU involved in acid resistance
MKINYNKVLIAGIVAGIVLVIVGFALGYLTASMYASTPQLWKPMSGDWTYTMIIFDIVIGVILAFVYSIVKDGVPKKGITKGLYYGMLVWLVGTIPGMIMTYSTMAVPTALVLAWTIGGLVQYTLMGATISWLHK